MTNIIFGKTAERAINKLEEIKIIFQECGWDIINVKELKNKKSITFVNHEQWVTWVALDADLSRTIGKRCHNVYIDPLITDPALIAHLRSCEIKALKF